MTPDHKIELIRREMKRYGIDAYIVPSSDPHASEYLPEYYKIREWASGFTGSSGTLVITQKRSALQTDGRYYIQADNELKGTEIELIKMGLPSEPTIAEWIVAQLKNDFTIGFNGFQMMTAVVDNLAKQLQNINVKWDYTTNIIDKIWLDRPLLPSEKVIVHEEFYAGESTTQKIARVRTSMKDLSASSHLISKLDDIAWLLNLRGNDIPNNPYFLSYLYITEQSSTLYIAPLKLNADIIDILHTQNVFVKDYNDINTDLDQFTCGTGLLLDKSSTPYHFYNQLLNRCKIIHHQNPSTAFKASKSSIELNHMRQCYKEDGAAVVKFMHWLEDEVMKGQLTELDIDPKLTAFRLENPLMHGKSFDTITAYKDHGAIMHYRPTKDTAYKIKPEGLLLVDSGAQYAHGTTDITRTIALGPLTDSEIRDYTLTLKSMMALSRAKFLKGATGTHLDQVARQIMWANGMDYKCGTGHGIGFFLGVHEGPQSISMKPSDVAIVPGMVISNEPGVYRNGVSGVRLENILSVVEDVENEFGCFYKFETLTMCPFDLSAIDLSLLSSEEILKLNEYHEKVRETLTPLLPEDVVKWLNQATRWV